jgi:hypothetical protein
VTADGRDAMRAAHSANGGRQDHVTTAERHRAATTTGTAR